MSNWFEKNRQAVHERIAWMKNQPDGILYDNCSDIHRILVRKHGTRIRMFFADPRNNAPNPRVSGCMSEFDLNSPLKPLVAYAQASLLPVLWRDTPQRVYVVGLAGGVVPLILHHSWPEVTVEASDIDPLTVNLAQEFFGVQLDERLRVTILDGREYLATQAPDQYYDFVLLDAFRGTGYSPYQLATIEFYQLCKQHLHEGGVVACNLVGSDPLLLEKINSMQTCFQNTYLHFDPDFVETYVLIGTDAEDLDEGERVARARRIKKEHQLSFNLAKRAADLKPLREQAEYMRRQFGESAELLSDKLPLPRSLNLSREDPLFYNVGRDDQCPCGSGEKFKRCHGAAD